LAETLLLYGESGTWKTTQAGVFAEYQAGRFEDAHIRLVSGDSTWKPLSHLIKYDAKRGHVGLVRPWSIKAPHPNKLAIISAASNGYWPNVIDEYGIADLTKGLTLNLESVAGIIWEGLTEVADLMMQHLVETRRDTGQKIHSTFEQTLPGVKEAFRYGGASQSAYGFVQAETRKYVKTLAALPVDRVLCTAHEGKGTDDAVTRKSMFGPMIVGKASNDKVSGWFGTTLHHESYMFADKERGAKPGVRAFFERHPDPEMANVFWPAKLDCTPHVAAKVLGRWPQGYIPLVNDTEGRCVSGVHSLLEMMDEEGEE
jgi:AAA domain